MTRFNTGINGGQLDSGFSGEQLYYGNEWWLVGRWIYWMTNYNIGINGGHLDSGFGGDQLCYGNEWWLVRQWI